MTPSATDGDGAGMPQRIARSSPAASRRNGWFGVVVGVALAAVTLLSRPAFAQGQLPDGFVDASVIDGLDQPVGFAVLPDGRRVFVVEQRTARIRLAVDGALGSFDPAGVVDGVNATGNEQGLLGIAIDPGWPARPYLYVHATSTGGVIKLSRFTVQGDLTFTTNGGMRILDGSRYDLLVDIPDQASNHNGGTLRFGPDGMLYVSLGDDASGCPAQDTVSLRGVILRLDVHALPPGGGGPPAKTALVAAGNPFATHPNLNARLVWALGLRNPFRFNIDPATGDLWIGDVGENTTEELDWVDSGGRDLGWPMYEGAAATGRTCAGAASSGFTFPVATFPTGAIAAIIGVGRYRRTSMPTSFPAEYEGNAFFGEYYSGFLRRIVLDGGSWKPAPPVPGQPDSTNWGAGFQQASDWSLGPDGGLWYCRQAVDYQNGTGAIRRITHAVTGAAGDAPPGALALAPPRPTPATGGVHLGFTLPAATRVRLEIHDVGGRRVRSLIDGVRPAGNTEVAWDGRDEDGSATRGGVYFVRLVAAGRALERRLVLLR